jgi:hypothetical protein
MDCGFYKHLDVVFERGFARCHWQLLRDEFQNKN